MNEDPYRPLDTALVMPNESARKAYRLVQPVIEHVFGFPELWDRYDCAKGGTATALAGNFMVQSGVDWTISESDRLRLEAIEGPLIVCCNHPFGGLDSLALISLIQQLRPEGWRLMANLVVSDIPEFREHMIPVDPLGGEKSQKANRQGMVAALRFVRSGGLLAMFPAGRVSHLDRNLGAVVDLPWSQHSLRMAESCNATLVVLHMPGQNSDRFLKISPKWSRFRALMLCREICRPPVQTMEIRIADVIKPEEVARIAKSKHPHKRLHAHCFLRADLDLPRPTNAEAPRCTHSTPTASKDLATSFDQLASDSRILEIAGRDVLLFKGADAPDAVMHEIGRCREVTFRAAGQGVGADVDLTPEDPYYHHLVVWDRSAGEVVGAYRMGKIKEIIDERGPEALYLDHIFKIDPALYEQLGNAFELSRSFVMPHFQRDNRALGALWKGLGEAANLHECGTFFGSVTISNDHHPSSRAILVEHLRRNYADSESLIQHVKARRPFEPATQYHSLVAEAYEGESIDQLVPLISRIENDERGVPPLMRYYCSLGAKFLAYHVEPEFQDALYCLLRVDLNAMDKRYRRRFLGA